VTVEGVVTLVQGEDGEPDGAVCVLRDVGERLATAARLERAEKLESLGLVAGGIAHVMNNLLTVIIGSTDFARREVAGSTSALGLLDDVDAAAGGLARVAEQMLTYAAVQFRQRESLDLSSVVGGCSERLRETAAGRVELQTELGRGLPAVTGDEHQLQQAVINLVTNAVEAADGPGGRVAVRTGSRRMTRDDFQGALLGSEEPEGTYVFIEVADNGTGMDAATMKSMFDPFFSTKFTGRGLGLALVHGAVQSHRGAIIVSSAPGAGTRVQVLLPAL
jgi:signal transduction histidine kinase